MPRGLSVRVCVDCDGLATRPANVPAFTLCALEFALILTYVLVTVDIFHRHKQHKSPTFG